MPKNLVQRGTISEKDIPLYKSVCDKLSLKDIQSQYFPYVSVRYLRTKMEEMGIRKRRIIPKYVKYNEDFFNEIKPLQAYYGGLLASDGCVRKVGKTGLRLQLKLKDDELLNHFKDDINFDGDIEYRSYFLKGGESTQIGKISLGGIQYSWANQLENIFSIVPRKTYSLIPPKLDDPELIKAYIKGYIDGDGTICIDKHNRLVLGICSHELIMMEWMKDFISKYIPITNKIYNPIQYHGKRTVHILQIGGETAYSVGKFIEPSIDRGLSRKWSKLEEWRNACLLKKNLLNT